SEAKTKQVQYIQYGILSPKTIMAMSVCEIVTAETYDSNRNPVAGGLMDLRMGTLERGLLCATCGEDASACQGHFGHIRLTKPVFHPHCISTIKKILEIFCVFCGELKLDVMEPIIGDILSIKNKKTRFNAAWSQAKTKMVCRNENCRMPQPKIKREGLTLQPIFDPNTVNESNSRMISSIEKILSPEKISNLFNNLSISDLHKIALSPENAHPAWFILTAIPVPPPQVRPSYSGIADHLSAQDDLTFKMGEIIKTNNTLARLLTQKVQNHAMEAYELLVHHVTTLMDNNIAGIPQSKVSNSRVLKGIAQRLKGKEGRLRGNLMGKRVEFSARTVVTGDPYLKVEEVGVPLKIAMKLTFPERVTMHNISKMRLLVANGTYQYPGAYSLTKSNGDVIKLSHVNGQSTFGKPVILPNVEIGDTVHRHIQDGDLVVFNRQPSLHKQSMMAHKAKIMPNLTFRLNLSATSPYNADFDGDEMNLHVPQSLQSVAELDTLLSVPTQIIGSKDSKPLMGIVQDSLLGSRLLTLRDTFLTYDQVTDLMMHIDTFDIPEPCIIKPVPLWSGKQLFSLLLPKTGELVINNSEYDFNDKSGFMTTFDTKVYFQDGYHVSGSLCKRTVGAVSGGLIQFIVTELDNTVAVDILNKIQRLTNQYLLLRGFSVGIGDAMTANGGRSQLEVANMVLDADKVVDKIVRAAKSGALQPQPGLSIHGTMESKIIDDLGKLRDSAGIKVTKEVRNPSNNFVHMMLSGAKGNPINLAQIAATVGQQLVEGKRIQYGFRNRSLPHFNQFDFAPTSRGFVMNSYLRGLSPVEFFFHTAGGREGLTDTAIKTAESGYLQRRLVKALEDIQVSTDGTVRDAQMNILQFKYGDDGFDTSKVQRRLFEPSGIWKKSEYEIKRVVYDNIETNYASILKNDSIALKSIYKTTTTLPFNINHIFNMNRDYATDFDLNLAMSAIESEIDAIQLPSLIKSIVRHEIVNLLIHSKTMVNFQKLFRILGDKIRKSSVVHSDMVGVLTAQSIGEPATQMTLNTFHLAGVGSRAVTLGVPRLKEILNATKNPRTPSMKIKVIVQPDEDAYRKAFKVAQKLEYTSLQDFVLHSDIVYSPYSLRNGSIPLWERVYIAVDTPAFEQKLSSWMIELSMNAHKLALKGYSDLQQIADLISKAYDGLLHITASKMEINNPSIRIRILSRDTSTDNTTAGELELLKEIIATLSNSVRMQGIPSISKTHIVEDNQFIFDPNLGDFKKETSYVIETEGIDLMESMSLDDVVYREVICDDPLQTERILGIEAARKTIINELKKVIEFDGSYVNVRHIMLLADFMCNKGRIKPITRFGINRGDTGVLTRATFEEAVDILINSSITGELDKCQGVSESIILGQVAKVGAGAGDIVVDE
ncbi:beta and beta-prime subunits of DNA dependent RNA-polymerase, partial [Gonapodya prolifera JEL478]